MPQGPNSNPEGSFVWKDRCTCSIVRMIFNFPLAMLLPYFMNVILFATLVATISSTVMVVMLTLSNCTVTPPSFSFPFSSLTFKASTMPLLTYKLWNFAIIIDFANLIFFSSFFATFFLVDNIKFSALICVCTSLIFFKSFSSNTNFDCKLVVIYAPSIPNHDHLDYLQQFFLSF